MGALISLQWLLDCLTGLGLLLLAWWALSSPHLQRAVVIFVAFGLLMSIAWVRLDAPDIALAEVAIGAGLTGALLLAALARLAAVESGQKGESHAGRRDPPVRVFQCLAALLLFMVAVGLTCSVLTLPLTSAGLSAEVAANIDGSGVRSPVTSVLLNFRGYDTLLEIFVLLLALLNVWSLGGLTSRPVEPAGLVLDALTRVLTPLLLLLSAYLLWVGSRAPGGAFQAGAVLGAAGVLLLLAGWRPDSGLAGTPLRLALVAGPGLFLAFAVATIVTGRNLLEFPPQHAGFLIAVLEGAATLSIGVTLAALFLGEYPRGKKGK